MSNGKEFRRTDAAMGNERRWTLHFLNQDHSQNKTITVRSCMSNTQPQPTRRYTVSQKTFHLWLAITLIHVNGFGYFLQKCYRYSRQSNDTLLCHIKEVVLLHYLAKRGNANITFFTQLDCCTHNAPVRCLPLRKNSHL